MGSEGLAAQFQAQLAALEALAAGRLAPDSTVLAACRGRVPAAAVAELAEAAAAAAAGDGRQQHTASGAATPAAAARENGLQQQQPSSVKVEPPDAADGGTAGAGAVAGTAGTTEQSEAERLQEAIRAKLRHLAPQQRKVQQEVLLERATESQCSEYRLMDWRRMRRPLPGTNPRAFEPPLQPVALLMQQQATRAQRAAVASRLERLQVMRLHHDRQQAQHHVQQQQQHMQQVLQPPAALGPPIGSGSVVAQPNGPPPLHISPNPFSRSGLATVPPPAAAGAPQASVQPQPQEAQQHAQDEQQQQQPLRAETGPNGWAGGMAAAAATATAAAERQQQLLQPGREAGSGGTQHAAAGLAGHSGLKQAGPVEQAAAAAMGGDPGLWQQQQQQFQAGRLLGSATGDPLAGAFPPYALQQSMLGPRTGG